MLESMPGEALLNNGTSVEKLNLSAENAGSNEALQEMADKLEKSEVSRKKLRRAIAMLKEQLEATEKVQQVNETLRKECEMERQRAEAERKKTKEEKTLREQIEKEGLSTKEQLVRVLQRLDTVERTCKSDRNDLKRMRQEMTQAVAGLNGAVKVVEGAQSSFQSMEKSLHGKVDSVGSASSKLTVLAQSAITDAKVAQEKATSTEILSQSLVSRVAVLQAEGARLDQRVSALHEELRSRPLDPLKGGLTANRDRLSVGMGTGAETILDVGVIMSTTQQRTGTCLDHLETAVKDWSAEGSDFGPKVWHPKEAVGDGSNNAISSGRDSLARCGTYNPEVGCVVSATGFTASGVVLSNRVNDKLQTISSSPVGGTTTHRDGLIDPMVLESKKLSVSSGGNIVRDALDAAKRRKDLLRVPSIKKVAPESEKISAVERSSLEGPSTHVSHSLKTCIQVKEFDARTQVDSANGSKPAFLGAHKNHINDAPAPEHAVKNQRSRLEKCPSLGTSISKNCSRAVDNNGAKTEVAIVEQVPQVVMKNSTKAEMKSELKMGTSGQRKDKLRVVLLKDITKLFQKERKYQAKIEGKLAALTSVLQRSSGNGDSTREITDLGEKKVGKRKRTKSVTDMNGKKVCRHRAKDGINDALVEKLVDEKLVVATKQSQVYKDVPLEAGGVEPCELGLKACLIEKYSAPAAINFHDSNLQGGAVDSAGEGRKWVHHMQDQEDRCSLGTGADVPATGNFIVLEGTKSTKDVMVQDQMMDMDSEYLSGNGELNGEWDSRSETSEDWPGDDWWATKGVLLSPNLPEILPPSSMFEVPDTKAASTSLGPKGCLDEIALFLDTLPSVDQEACHEVRTEETITDTINSKLEIEGSYAQSDKPMVSEEYVKGAPVVETSQIKEARDSLNGLYACRESPIGNNLDCSFERGIESSDMRDEIKEMENKENVVEGSSILRGPSSMVLRPMSSVLLAQEANVVMLGKCMGLGSSSTCASEVGTEENMKVSCCDGEQEKKFSTVQVAAKDHFEELSCPYSLELVLGPSGCEPDVAFSGSCMDKSDPSPPGMSGKISSTLGRARKFFYQALSCPNSDLQSLNLELATRIASTFADNKVSRACLTGIFTASLVDSYALFDNEELATSLVCKSKSLQHIIDIAIPAFVSEVFQEVLPPYQVFSMFVDQLEKFIIHGSLQAFFEEASEDGSISGQYFHFTPSPSEVKQHYALVSGSKLLACFCERNGKLDFLRNSVYLVLRFCEKDNLWVLAAFSSFAICCKSLFEVDSTDLVGQAVQVVISELLNDVDAGKQVECKRVHPNTGLAKAVDMVDNQLEMEQGSVNGTEVHSDKTRLHGSLCFLTEVIGNQGGLSFEAFVPRLLNSLHSLMSATFSSHRSDVQHEFQRSLWMRPCNQIDSKTGNLIAFSCPGRTSEGSKAFGPPDGTCNFTNVLRNREKDEGQTLVEEYGWRFCRGGSSALPSTSQLASQSQLEITVIDDWEQKLCDLANAMELVACHLGWEWTYNDLIVGHLWNFVTPGAPAVNVACVAHMFGILGCLGRAIDGTELPGVDELRKSLLAVLNTDPSSSSWNGGCVHEFSICAQVAAVQSLLGLSSTFNKNDDLISSEGMKNNHISSRELKVKSVRCSWSWFQALDLEMQDMLPSSLRSALLSVLKSPYFVLTGSL